MSKNYIDGAGIHTETYAETVAALQAAFRSIYGADINLDSNTPDGQLIGIFALAKQDFLALITQDYNSKDPDQAVGAALDGICALCGIYRKGGTYTKVTVTITTDRAVELAGLDTSDTPFTVADQNGNQFYLLETNSIAAAGSYNLNFRAKDIGAVQVQTGTITTAVTVVLGVTAITNAGGAYEDGVDQETDAQLRVRRQKSTSMPAQGFLSSLRAGILSLDGVTSCLIFENNTGDADVNSVPGHSIWVIVDGGTDADIANTIYKYRNAGCGMKGTEIVQVTQADGSVFTIYFDRADQVNLRVRFSISVIGGGSYDADFLKSQLALLYQLGIFDPADITTVAALVKGINPSLVASDIAVSKNGTDWETDLVYPDSKQDRFVLTAANITIL